MCSSLFDGVNRSAEDYEVMYEQIRAGWIDAPPEGGSLARPSSSASDDVRPAAQATPSTPSTPSTPTASEGLDGVLDDPGSEFDQIPDREEVIEGEAVERGEPLAVRRHAMAADFSEGKLETLVDSPQKELAGTQNQYVSYQVTTKVNTAASSLPCTIALTLNIVRLPILPEIRVLRPPPLHRLRLPLQAAIEGIPTMRRPAATRQAQDGVCTGRPLWT